MPNDDIDPKRAPKIRPRHILSGLLAPLGMVWWLIGFVAYHVWTSLSRGWSDAPVVINDWLDWDDARKSEKKPPCA